MIFLTVGTLYPFDRLVGAVDDAVANGLITEDVFAQIGVGGIQPTCIESVESLDKMKFDKIIKQSSCLISHAGMGSIQAALSLGKPLLVMPRLYKYSEHINDHQVATAAKFEELGHVLAVYEEDQIPKRLEDIKTFTPRKRDTQVDKVVERISDFLNCIDSE
jgi:UDP-N-acetylglucosamine transferase subunit ALG13